MTITRIKRPAYLNEYKKQMGELKMRKVEKKESKMVYGLGMNIHQLDQHTIQMYVLDVKEGKRPHAPVTVEHPDKHPGRVKANGQPYAREHETLFNVLKGELIRQGKWIEQMLAIDAPQLMIEGPDGDES